MIRTLLFNPRRVVKTLLGKDFFLQVDTRIPHERFGSDYGGWNVVTDTIHSGSVIYSFGIGHDVSFDVQMMQRFGVTIHGFDPTPGSIAWVENNRLPEQFVLHRYGLAAADGDVTFYPPENPDHISHSMLEKAATSAQAITVPVKCLKTIMTELGHDSVDVLKMDIEGAEYQVLESLLESEIRPHQILVEFHHRFTGAGIGTTRQAVARLKKAGYRLFCVSRSVEEFCFIR
jgi:FkbM family methyltransferase